MSPLTPRSESISTENLKKNGGLSKLSLSPRTTPAGRHGQSERMGLEKRIRQFEDNPDLRFLKIKRASKRPIEKGWPDKGYTYGEILPHIKSQTNYGVLCGHGGLAVPDADSPELEEAIEKSLPETFTVQTGGGGKHYYYICPEVKKRVVLEWEGTHYGEIQSVGQAIVGPGSIHPNGNRYLVARDHPIVTIDYDELFAAIQPFIKERKQPKIYLPPTPRFDGTRDINSIPITQVIDVTEYKRAHNGELYGPNPWHGSKTGSNTWINEEKNVAYCFRHHAGISVVKAIALNVGIITECDEELNQRQFIQVLNHILA